MELWKIAIPLFMLPVSCFSQNFIRLIGCNSAAPSDVIENWKPTVTCQSNTGFSGDVYWSLTYLSNKGTEVRIGQCKCFWVSCTNCTAINTNFSITADYEASQHHSISLQFLNNQQNINGAVVKCSTFDNTSQANCSLRFIKVSVYNVSACGSNGLLMEENNEAIVTCDRPDSSQSTVWQIIYENGTVQNVTGCVDCSHSSPSDKPCFCDQHIGAIDYSYLWVERVDSNLDHTALKCFQQNNTYSECEIRVQLTKSSDPTTTLSDTSALKALSPTDAGKDIFLHSSMTMSSDPTTISLSDPSVTKAFPSKDTGSATSANDSDVPLGAIIGGTVAGVVVVTVAVILVVVYKRKNSKQQSRDVQKLSSFVPSSSTTAVTSMKASSETGENTYDRLQGDPETYSPYTSLREGYESIPNATAGDPDQTTYETLDGGRQVDHSYKEGIAANPYVDDHL